MTEIKIAGTWRENSWNCRRQIHRQDADAELKKLCAMYLPGDSENRRAGYATVQSSDHD